MTFQILSQDGQSLLSTDGEVRNNDEAELRKSGIFVDQSIGEPSFDFDMAEDLRELGIVQP
jgi:predicted amidohydrolase